jgi:hypothetical protein
MQRGARIQVHYMYKWYRATEAVKSERGIKGVLEHKLDALLALCESCFAKAALPGLLLFVVVLLALLVVELLLLMLLVPGIDTLESRMGVLAA